MQRDANSIYINYAGKSGLGGSGTNEIKLETKIERVHECCMDVSKNFLRRNPRKYVREATKEETNELSMRKVIMKTLTSYVLLSTVVFFAYTLSQQENGIVTGIIPFDCDPASETSIITKGLAGDPSFCYFKWYMIVLSFLFLVPFVMETFSIVTIIWVSMVNFDVLIPIADGQYVGREGVFDTVHSSNFFKRFFSSLLVIYYVPKEILAANAQSGNGISSVMIVFEIVWKFLVFMLPDILFNLILFYVSYLVLLASDGAEDLFVDLVAVQVFAQLDDMLVKMLMRPRSSVGEAIQNYVRDNPEGTFATYNPLEAYVLNENRHEMGLKTSGVNPMAKFHDYDGFHLA